MAGNVYVDTQGRKYTAAAPKSAADSFLPFVDPALPALLTAVPADELAVKAAFVAAKVAAAPGRVGKGGNDGGWLWGVAALFLTGTLLFSGAAEAQQTPGHLVAAASTNATLVTTGSGALSDFQAVNSTAALAYVRFYDTATTPVCTSSVGVIANFQVPFATSGNGITAQFPKGKAYGNGLGFCITAGNGDADNTPLAGTGVTIDFDYGLWFP